jgi:hypothetical protein
MYRYSGFSLNIDSQLELPELSPGCGHPDVTIRLGDVSRPQAPATIDDEAAFPGNIGGFHIMRGREIVVDLFPGADAGAVRTLLAGRIMACLLRQRGHLPLHASAIAIDGQGALFLGESGSGKSTTAAAFRSRGHDVLADDVAAVRTGKSGIELQTAWPGLRLLEDSRNVIGAGARSSGFQVEKHIYCLKDPGLAGPYPVKRIYFLDPENSCARLPVCASALSVFSAVALLNAHSFISIRRTGHALRQINLDRAAAVAAAGLAFRLIRPRSLNLLPLLVDFVEKDVLASA